MTSHDRHHNNIQPVLMWTTASGSNKVSKLCPDRLLLVSRAVLPHGSHADRVCVMHRVLIALIHVCVAWFRATFSSLMFTLCTLIHTLIAYMLPSRVLRHSLTCAPKNEAETGNEASNNITGTDAFGQS